MPSCEETTYGIVYTVESEEWESERMTEINAPGLSALIPCKEELSWGRIRDEYMHRVAWPS